MPVKLVIEDIPDSLAFQLKVRARLNHCSLEKEVLAILRASIEQDRSPRPPKAPEN